ncbi:hypothetical protein [Actinacidiphila yeochonensis]|nr:hypothetical protein [Actinacidiphila yeochonensis]
MSTAAAWSGGRTAPRTSRAAVVLLTRRRHIDLLRLRRACAPGG